jgi:pyruvate,water dikinase
MTSLERAPATAFVRPFGELERRDAPYAGDAAVLGDLIDAGFDVAPGFVVGTPAFAELCEAHGLRARIDDRLRGVDLEDPRALRAASADVRDLIEREPVPAAVEAAIRDALRSLTRDEDAPVTVWPAPAGADPANAARSGVDDRISDVRGHEALLAAVRRCWSSPYAPRAIVRRAERGLGRAAAEPAVVVQHQVVTPIRAGAVRTYDPTVGDPDLLVVESGDARYVVNKWLCGVLEWDRVTEHTTLSDAQVRALAVLGREVEHRLGAPQAIEWAYDPSGDLRLLRAHPISPAPEARPAPRPAAPLAPIGSYLTPAFGHARARDAMHPFVITCDGATALITAAQRMVGEHIHALVVRRDDSRAPWALLTVRDVIRCAGSLHDLTAGDAATGELIEVAADDPLADVADAMLERDVSHAVVMHGARAVGVISTFDIAAILAWGRG